MCALDYYSRKEYMNICSVELFLRKFLTGRGHFFLALAGSRLMPLINNATTVVLNCPGGLS
jgi:hypothetical protein